MASSQKPEKQLTEREVSKLLYKQIKEDFKALKHEAKLLLLGSSESGKTTVVKQMKQCFDGGFNDAQKEEFKKAIYVDIRHSMAQILQFMDQKQIPLGEGLEEARSCINNYVEGPLDFDKLAALWADAGVKKAFERANEFHLSDGAGHFFNSLDRIRQPDFVPTTDDIFRVRIQTHGISETKIKVGLNNYVIVDVAGQKSERRKWIHQFENVTAVIFVIAVSSFDQVMWEDFAVNRLRDALKLFQSVCEERWFTKVSMIVFLNKVDLLEEKLKKTKFRHYINEYESKNDVAHVTEYIGQLIYKMAHTDKRQVYLHLTCATDSEKFKFVLLAVTDTITHNQLRQVGLM